MTLTIAALFELQYVPIKAAPVTVVWAGVPPLVQLCPNALQGAVAAGRNPWSKLKSWGLLLEVPVRLVLL